MSGILAALAGIKTAIATAVDEYFNRTTLLLNTSSTNGAQNNTFLDSSTNNFTITRNGNTTQGTFTPFSQTGWSGYFDGASDHIQFTNSDFSVSTGDLTAEWFMFITSDKAQVGIMTAATNSNLTIGYGSGSANARQPYVEWGGAGAYIGTMSNYMNTWVHICVMRSSGTVYTFQNGTLLSSASKSASVGATTNMVIGTNAGDVGGQGVPGYLSNVRFAKAAIYSTSGFTAPTLPLTRTSQSATNVQFLTLQSNRFLDSNGINTPASSPLAITTYNDVSIQAFSPFAPTAAYDSAVVGGSGYFDGTGDWLTAPNNTAFGFGSGNFTIEAWYYPTVTSPNSGLFGKRANGSVYGPFVVEFASSLAPTFYFSTTGSSWNSINSSVSCLANSWNHIAATRSGSTFTIWINGVSGGTASTASALMTNTDAVSIGAVAADGTRSVTGYLSGSRLIKGTAQYTTTFTPPTAPPTAITNTSLLLNYTNAGIYDSAAKNDLETVGNAQVSTTQAKWGTTSMYFDGTGDSLKGKLNNAIGGGDYTTEGWLYTGASGARYIFDMRETSQYLGAFTVGTTLYVNIGTTLDISATTSYPQNTWVHFAMVRSGSATNNTSVFLGGSRITQVTDTTNYSIIPTLYVGNDNTGAYSWSGYIDDFRITKGYARYSGSTYTPPAEAFPLQ